MKKINHAALQKGDIILTTSGEMVSKVVRIGTLSDISHAMIYVANGSVIDSTMDGVHARNIQKILYDDRWPVYVLRLKTPISGDKIDRIIKYVRSEAATSYSVLGAATSALSPFWKGGRKQFCSRLIARAYASVGVKLNGNPEFCTPKKLKKSPKLVVVKNPTVHVSKEEQEILEQVGDGSRKMREITNELMERIRKLIPGAQSLNDIDDALVANMALDEQVAAFFQDSGYLDFWIIERTKHSWRYQIELMAQMHSLVQKNIPGDDCLEKYCEQTLKDDADGDYKHWMDEMDKYVAYANQFPSKTFDLLRGTYWNLIQSHAMRVSTAKTYLQWRSHFDK